MLNKKNIFYIFILLFLVNEVRSADRYWIAGSTANWNSTANWSTTSGGSSGASVPGSSDKAIFNGGGTGNCTINANISVLHIDVRNNYTGTITQNTTRTITIGTGGSFAFSGGTFSGGDADITISGTFTLDSNGVFTSTSSKLIIRGNVKIIDGDVFTHNNGQVSLHSSTGGTTVTADFDTISLYDFRVNDGAGSKSVTFDSDNEITVNNDFKLDGSTTSNEIVLFGAKIFLKGDVYVEYFRTNSSGQGTTELIFDGSGNQKIDASGNGAGGSLFKVTINKSASDTLFLYGKFRQDNNWDYNSGFIHADTSSRITFFRGSTISGTMTFHKVRFQNLSTSFTWNITDTITVNNTLEFIGDNVIYLLTGEIHCKGDFNISANTATNISGAYMGTTKIYFDGTGNQNWIGKSSYSYSWMPVIIIDKPSGTLDIIDHITIGTRLHYIQGSIDYNTSTISAIKNCDITGNDFGLYNFSIAALTLSSTSSAIGLNDSTLLTVNGTLTFGNSSTTSVVYFASGVVHAKGNVEVTNDQDVETNAAEIIINGAGNQTLDGAAAYTEGNLPKVTINKPSGTLYLKDYINVSGNWKYISGTIDYSTNSNTLTMRTTFEPSIIGSHSISDLKIYRISGSLTKHITVRNTSTLTVNGNLTTFGTSLFVLDSGTIDVKGNFDISNGLNGGTTILIASGANNQTYDGNVGLTYGELPNFIMNKSGGSFTVTNNMNIQKSLTLTNGIIKAPTSSDKIHFIDNATLSGGSKISYVDGIVSKLGNDAFTFPTGENGIYRPLTMTAPSSTSANFETEYFATKQTLGTSFDTAYAEISPNEYWQFSRSVGSSTVKATMAWSENKFEIPGDSTTLGSLYWNSGTSKWVGITNDLISGNANTGSLRGVTLTTYSYLVLGKRKVKNNYAATHHKLDGGFYLTKNKRLYVEYKGEYNASQFRFNIYDTDDNSIAATENSPGVVDKYYVKEGDNRFTFNFSTTSGFSIPSGFYILEIINDKNEKEYLRFQKL